MAHGDINMHSNHADNHELANIALTAEITILFSLFILSRGKGKVITGIKKLWGTC